MAPRGEVNAADASGIGSFDEDDVKGIKLSEADQEIYTAFNHVNSERWQQEIAGMLIENSLDAIKSNTVCSVSIFLF